MCNPVALGVASLVSTVASAYAQNQQSEAQRSAMKKAEGNYTSRLNDVQNQSQQVINDTTGKFGADAQAQQMAGEKSNMEQQMRQNLVPVASAGDATTKSANPVVSDLYNKVAQDAHQSGLAQGYNAAALNQWTNNRFLNDITTARSGQQIGKLANFAQGWQPVYQAEMAGARNAGSGWGTLGSVLGGVGSLTGIGAGAMAGGAFGGSGLTPANTASNFVNSSGQIAGISPSAQWAGGNFYVPGY